MVLMKHGNIFKVKKIRHADEKEKRLFQRVFEP